MTMFHKAVEFNIVFGKGGIVVIVFTISPMYGFMAIDEPWVAFGSLADAREFFQMGIDFCDKNEVKVPQVFENSFEEKSNGR